VSVLLAGLDPRLVSALTRRLLAAGDQVRVIAAAGEDPRSYEGAHVARGEVGDDDLVERAAQGARTIVLGDVGDAARAAALAGAAAAGVDRAVLICSPPAPGADVAVPARLSWVALVLPAPGLLRRRTLPAEALAKAVDAADDMAGEPRLVADLATDEGWALLRLDPPAR
jgi:hypothetical protein